MSESHLCRTIANDLREIQSHPKPGELLCSGHDCQYAMCSTDCHTKVRTALMSLQGLRHLEVVNGTPVVDFDLLKSIGSGPESLTLYECTESTDPMPSRPLGPESLLTQMRTLCPRLKTLELVSPWADHAVRS